MWIMSNGANSTTVGYKITYQWSTIPAVDKPEEKTPERWLRQSVNEVCEVGRRLLNSGK